MLFNINYDINEFEILKNLEKKRINIQTISAFDINSTKNKIFILGYTQIPLDKIEAGIDLIIKEIKGYN